MPNAEPKRIFISYSRADQRPTNWLEKLGLQLAVIERRGSMTVWDDTRIRAGSRWRDEIEKALEQADTAVLLVGPGFLKSEFIAHHELPPLLRAAAERGVRIFPLVTGYCLYRQSELEPFQAFNDPEQPLEGLHPPEQNRVLRDLAAALDAAVRDARRRTESGDGPRPPAAVLAVMGVRGGVGKTTIVSCIAQLIAELGHEVAVIDFDLMDVGGGAEAKRRFPGRSFAVKSVYDHIAPHSTWPTELGGAQDPALSEITPDYLASRGLGRIWFVPARDPLRNKQPSQVLSHVRASQTEILRQVTHEVTERVREQRPAVRVILIDCGATRQTLYAAAFAEAIVGYVVAPSNEAHFDKVHEIRTEMTELYPDLKLAKVHTIVNRVTSRPELEAGLQKLSPKPLVFVPSDPTVERDNNLLGSVEFGLGYNAVFAKVQEALAQSLPAELRALVPDEIDVRFKSWLRTLVEERVAEKKRRSAAFRLRLAAAWGIPVLLSLALGGLLLLAPFGRPLEAMGVIWAGADAGGGQLGLLRTLLLAATVLAWYRLLAIDEARRRLLKRFARLPSRVGPEHRALLREVLDARYASYRIRWLSKLVKHRSLLRWVKELVEVDTDKRKYEGIADLA